jgi:DNA ligase-1
MSSPSKKRKLNNGSNAPAPASKGLEYFFSKQRQNGTKSANNPAPVASSDAGPPTTEMTDEELARKLQAEWDQEAASERQTAQTKSQPETGESSETSSVKESVQTPEPNQPLVLPISLSKPNPLKEKSKPTLGLQAAGISEDTTSTLIPLDESPLTFEPSKYLPQLHDHWASEGGDASYALLTRCFVLVSGTTSRIKIVDTLVNCLRILIEGDPLSLLPAVGL